MYKIELSLVYKSTPMGRYSGSCPTQALKQFRLLLAGVLHERYQSERLKGVNMNRVWATTVKRGALRLLYGSRS